MATLQLHPKLVAHHISMRIENTQRSIGKVALVINRHLCEFWVLLPVLIKNQKQFLCSTESKDWHQAFASTRHNVCDVLCKVLFSLFATLMFANAISALDDQYVNLAVGKLRRL